MKLVLVPWTSEEPGSELTLLLFFQYMETAETPRADDPVLLKAAAPYGSFNTAWLKQAIRHLSAPAPSPWQRADFGQAVDADQWTENLSALLFEFMADQRRRAGVPLSKSYLARNEWLEAILRAVRFSADHLYSFFMSGRAWDESTEYASPYGEGPSAAEVKIGDLPLRMKQRFLYLFDYGDEHRFEVQLVGINPEAPKDRYPKILEKHGRPPRQYGGW